MLIRAYEDLGSSSSHAVRLRAWLAGVFHGFVLLVQLSAGCAKRASEVPIRHARRMYRMRSTTERPSEPDLGFGG